MFIDSGDEVPRGFTHIANVTICTNKTVKNNCKTDRFSVKDRANTETNTEYQLKMKEAMHIKWIEPKLNKQVKHYTY